MGSRQVVWAGTESLTELRAAVIGRSAWVGQAQHAGGLRCLVLGPARPCPACFSRAGGSACIPPTHCCRLASPALPQAVVSVGVEERSVQVSNWRQVAERARLCALALRRLGVRCGQLGRLHVVSVPAGLGIEQQSAVAQACQPAALPHCGFRRSLLPGLWPPPGAHQAHQAHQGHCKLEPEPGCTLHLPHRSCII